MAGIYSKENGEIGIMVDDFMTPALAIILALVLTAAFNEFVVIPLDMSWLFAVVLVIFLAASYSIVVCIENFLCYCKDADNIKCRIFGHSDKNLGKRVTILCPNRQPNDFFEYTAYQCRRCGHMSDGGMFHNISYDKRDIGWKTSIF